MGSMVFKLIYNLEMCIVTLEQKFRHPKPKFARWAFFARYKPFFTLLQRFWILYGVYESEIHKYFFTDLFYQYRTCVIMLQSIFDVLERIYCLTNLWGLWIWNSSIGFRFCQRFLKKYFCQLKVSSLVWEAIYLFRERFWDTWGVLHCLVIFL